MAPTVGQSIISVGVILSGLAFNPKGIKEAIARELTSVSSHSLPVNPMPRNGKTDANFHDQNRILLVPHKDMT